MKTIHIGDVFMEYNKDRQEVKIWSQCYDSSVFDSVDFFKCVERIKKQK
jgi:hypothetical protein